jgi:hypothetical protein
MPEGTDPNQRVQEGRAWDPWDALDSRPHLECHDAVLTGCTGLIEDRGAGRRRIYLEVSLDDVEARCILTHELIHDERGLLYTADTPKSVVIAEEAAVNAEMTRRLVPPDQLASYLADRDHGPADLLAAIADHFYVTREVAARALDALDPSGTFPTGGDGGVLGPRP